MFRRSVLLGALLALAIPLVPVQAQTQVQTGERVLQVVSPWEISSLVPSDTGYIAARLGVAETLVGVEPDGKIVGLVADRWTVSPDHLTWRFHLRPSLRFHNDTKVTAQDVVDSFERGRPDSETLPTLPISTVSAQGDEVVIVTRTPFSPLPAFLADYGGIILAPESYAPDGHVVSWIGTGPYKVVGQQGDRIMDLAAAETSRIKPAITRVRYTAAPLGETRAAMIESGDADIAYTLLPTAAARINAGPVAHVVSLTIPRVRFLTFNTALPMFSDVRVRRAISLGIDRAGIAAAILRHPPSTADQLFPPVLAQWHDDKLPPLTYDPTQAAALLAQAGWQRGADGVLRKDGAAFRFTLLVPNNRQEMAPMATAMQEQFKALGIDMQVKVGPNPATPQAHKDGTLEAAFTSRTYVNVPDPIGTILPDFTRPHTIWASENWHSDEMDSLVAAYVANFDEARQPPIRRRIAEILQQELPVVTVSWTEHTVAVSNRVTGVQVDPYELRYLIERMRWAD
ncbi:MAG TPA: ABC transporter substrate-binding protein [Acetobacteraceae bacterium]